jgi:hypothetical protein
MTALPFGADGQRRGHRGGRSLVRRPVSAHLRPVFHWSEARVRGHIAICVMAAVIETLMAADLRSADVRDPDLADQHLSPARALRELGRVRAVTLSAGERRVRVVTGRSAPGQALAAFGVDTSGWSRAQVA